MYFINEKEVEWVYYPDFLNYLSESEEDALRKEIDEAWKLLLSKEENRKEIIKRHDAWCSQHHKPWRRLAIPRAEMPNLLTSLKGEVKVNDGTDENAFFCIIRIGKKKWIVESFDNLMDIEEDSLESACEEDLEKIPEDIFDVYQKYQDISEFNEGHPREEEGDIRFGF